MNHLLSSFNHPMLSFLKDRMVHMMLIGAAVFLFALPLNAHAQGLNWEGQTGAFVTPFAYTVSSPSNSIGKPELSFHYMNTGPIIGHSLQTSVTVGAFKRIEFGYTRAFNAGGNNKAFSALFDSGFNVFHAKVNVIPENVKKANWVPAISVGGVVRSQVQHVGGVLGNKDTTNGDVYVAVTKTVTQIKGLPFLINAGYKATNGSLFGIAGNAPAWKGRAFGAVAFVVPGPAKSTLILGSEFAQQPRDIEGLPGAVMPTSLTYFVRILPNKEVPMAIDFGVAQAAGKILPGVDLKARAQFAMGLSYRF